MYCGFQILLNPFGDQILHHAIVSQKLQNTHTFVAKITIWISAHPNFVQFLGLLYISEKICTFHFLSQTGIGPLHCQSYARRSNMGKCHKLVLGLKFWSVYIFKKSAGSDRSQSLFYFVPQEKGLIISQSFTCALIGFGNLVRLCLFANT